MTQRKSASKWELITKFNLWMRLRGTIWIRTKNVRSSRSKPATTPMSSSSTATINFCHFISNLMCDLWVRSWRAVSWPTKRAKRYWKAVFKHSRHCKMSLKEPRMSQLQLSLNCFGCKAPPQRESFYIGCGTSWTHTKRNCETWRPSNKPMRICHRIADAHKFQHSISLPRKTKNSWMPVQLPWKSSLRASKASASWQKTNSDLRTCFGSWLMYVCFSPSMRVGCNRDIIKCQLNCSSITSAKLKLFGWTYC